MNIISKHMAVPIAVIALLAGSAASHAVILVPGSTSPQVGAPTETAGVLVATTTGNINGIPDINPASTVAERVVRTGAGTLDFYFQVNSVAPATGLIHQFNANFYASYVTDVFWDNSPVVAGVITQAGNPLNGLPSGTIIPDSFARTASGNAIQWNFPDPPTIFGGTGPITDGDLSKWLVIRTNATEFGPGIGGVINGITQNFPLIGPVPEPGTCLFGLGLLGVMASRIRGRRSRSASAC